MRKIPTKTELSRGKMALWAGILLVDDAHEKAVGAPKLG
jgi:hypothetical protein